MKKIRILSVTPYSLFPTILGGQKSIIALYKYMVLTNKCDIFLYTTQAPDAQQVLPFKVFPCIPSSKWKYMSPFVCIALWRAIKKHAITHLFFDHSYLGWMAFLLKKMTKKKLVFRFHNIESIRFKSLQKKYWYILWLYEKWVCKKADFIFFISEEDKQYAIAYFGISPNKTALAQYGIDMQALPTVTERQESKQWAQQQYHIPHTHKIFSFIGLLSYLPNREAVDKIIEEINPRLKHSNISYTILIGGEGLEEYKKDDFPHIVFTGFVADIHLFYMATDVFLNPVLSGGGIKTKLVEAIAYGCKVVSTQLGSAGVSPAIVPNNMVVVENDDWDAFVKQVLLLDLKDSPLDVSLFFKQFYWGNIASVVVDSLLQV